MFGYRKAVDVQVDSTLQYKKTLHWRTDNSNECLDNVYLCPRECDGDQILSTGGQGSVHWTP